MYSTIEEAWGHPNPNANTNPNANANANANANTNTNTNANTNVRCILEKKNVEHFFTNSYKNKCKKNIIQAFLIGILIILILQLIHNKFL
jgi:hypothetical protein